MAEKRTLEQKVNILKRALQRRIDNLPEFTKQFQQQINIFENQRKKLVDSIKQYEKDEFVHNILKEQLTYLDTQYEKEMAEKRIELERLRNSETTLRLLTARLDEVIQYPNSYVIVDNFIDLFLSRALDDWEEDEKRQAEAKAETNADA
jgi:parvulin-like peptidyl-prolyl isomerase